jgi:hypothetical protein
VITTKLASILMPRRPASVGGPPCFFGQFREPLRRPSAKYFFDDNGFIFREAMPVEFSGKCLKHRAERTESSHRANGGRVPIADTANVASVVESSRFERVLHVAQFRSLIVRKWCVEHCCTSRHRTNPGLEI